MEDGRAEMPKMAADDPQSGSGFERYREYLGFVAGLHLDPQLQGKVDLSGVVQQTLLEAHLAQDGLRSQPSHNQLAWLRSVLAHNLADEIRKVKSEKRDVRRERSL